MSKIFIDAQKEENFRIFLNKNKTECLRFYNECKTLVRSGEPDKEKFKDYVDFEHFCADFLFEK